MPAPEQGADASPTQDAVATPPASPSHGATVLAALDTTVSPCDDFYQFSCGGWSASTEIPGDQSRWTRSFSALRENNRSILKEALETLAASPNDGSENAMLGAFYTSCMDETAIEDAGIEAIAPLLKRALEVKDLSEFMTFTGELHRLGVHPLFGIYVGPDDKNPGRNIAHLGQSGLGLPDRDYYLDESRAKLRMQYVAHLAMSFELIGETTEASQEIAKDVMAFETKLAKLQLTRTERRDPNRTYNKIDIGGLRKISKKLDWNAYLTAIGQAGLEDINVESPQYMKKATKLLAAAAPATLQNYLRWNTIRGHAHNLNKAMADADFEFFNKTLRGQKQQEARWKRCASAVGGAMPHAMGKIYVEKAFGGDSKAIAEDLIHRIEAAFESNLPNLAWMDETTRSRAVEKMNAIGNKVGYPDKPRTYEGLKIEPGAFVANVQAASVFNHDYWSAKVGKTVDRNEWRGSPQTVNASYSSTRNEMWFPAGILQAPFFDADYPMAMNFGGIGMVMGHELTHGFDDQGRKFDGTGMLTDWWEPSAVEKFESRTECVEKSYSSQEVEPGLNVNGKLTMGENIADLGGLKETFYAYRTWAKENGGDTQPHVEGLTNEQLLFVAYAQVWCTKMTPEAARVQVATDPHSPSQFRVNVPAMHTREFAEVFACEEGRPMAPKNRCEVW